MGIQICESCGMDRATTTRAGLGVCDECAAEMDHQAQPSDNHRTARPFATNSGGQAPEGTQ